jgi:DNA-binding response OmpR family regulator
MTSIRLSKLRSLIVKHLLNENWVESTQLYCNIWGSDFIDLQLLYVHIHYLRKELKKIGASILSRRDGECIGYYKLVGITELRGRVVYAEDNDIAPA